MALLLSYKWFRSLLSPVRFSGIPNEIVIIKQMNAVCWRIIIDVPPLITRGRGTATTRVVVYNRSYSNHKHDYALERHTPPPLLDSESFTIITRFDGVYRQIPGERLRRMQMRALTSVYLTACACKRAAAAATAAQSSFAAKIGSVIL